MSVIMRGLLLPLALSMSSGCPMLGCYYHPRSKRKRRML